MSHKIRATDQGFILPPGTSLAIIDAAGTIIDAPQNLADELFRVAGNQYLAAMEKFLGQHAQRAIHPTSSNHKDKAA